MSDLQTLKDYCDREIELLEDEIERLDKDDAGEPEKQYILNNTVAITTLKRVLNKISFIQGVS